MSVRRRQTTTNYALAPLRSSGFAGWFRTNQPGERPATFQLRRALDKIFPTGVFLALLMVLTSVAQLGSSSDYRSRPSSLLYVDRSRSLGLQIQSRVILDSLSYPSLDELRRMGVTYLGTNVYSDFSSRWWATLGDWNRKAHGLEFKTYAYIDDLDQASSLALTAVRNGFDAIELDEMISKHRMTQEQFTKIVSITREVKWETEFIITESDRNAIRQAFRWASQIPNVRVASSDYSDLSTIDYVMGLQRVYGAKAIVWLIFIPDSNYDWKCYKDIQEWIEYAKSSDADVFLWSIDADGSWKARWEFIKSLLTY